jgi:septal ring factor EnvC (AmiA/AmiB activator)
MTIEQLLQAVNDAGFDQQTLTLFLRAGKAQVQIGMLNAQINKKRSEQSASAQQTEADIQGLQQQIAAVQAELEDLQP